MRTSNLARLPSVPLLTFSGHNDTTRSPNFHFRGNFEFHEPTSQKTHCFSVMKTRHLTLFIEIIADCCENNTEHENTLHRQNTLFLILLHVVLIRGIPLKDGLKYRILVTGLLWKPKSRMFFSLVTVLRRGTSTFEMSIRGSRPPFCVRVCRGCAAPHTAQSVCAR